MRGSHRQLLIFYYLSFNKKSKDLASDKRYLIEFETRTNLISIETIFTDYKLFSWSLCTCTYKGSPRIPLGLTRVTGVTAAIGYLLPSVENKSSKD